MSKQENKNKKNKKKKIVTGVIGSTAAGILLMPETNEEKNKKKEVQMPKEEEEPILTMQQKQKINLNTKVQTLWANILYDANKINQELDSTILSNSFINVHWNPTIVNPIIKYFSDEQGKNDVSNESQKVGYLYVVITADDNDLNYQGSTKPIKIILKQYKLSDITKLNGLFSCWFI